MSELSLNGEKKEKLIEASWKFNSELTVDDIALHVLLENSVAKGGCKKAVVFGTEPIRSITYEEFSRRSNILANCLKSKGTI